jgi:hypothetical protein
MKHQTAENAEPLVWQPLWDAMKADFEQQNDKWQRTTKEMYWEMLEVLPPHRMKLGAFLVGEAWSTFKGEEVYACFSECGTSYYAKYLTTRQFHEATGDKVVRRPLVTEKRDESDMGDMPH